MASDLTRIYQDDTRYKVHQFPPNGDVFSCPTRKAKRFILGTSKEETETDGVYFRSDEKYVRMCSNKYSEGNPMQSIFEESLHSPQSFWFNLPINPTYSSTRTMPQRRTLEITLLQLEKRASSRATDTFNVELRHTTMSTTHIPTDASL